MATVHGLRGRRTQEERSKATQALVLDAALACLEELGYARCSTTEIAKRAGVSRGAQLHHFPTKAALVAEAVRHLFDRRHAEFLEAFRRLEPTAHRLDSAIDLLWSMVRGQTFVVWLELLVGSRTDPELASEVQSLSGEFIETVEETFRALFPAEDDLAPFVSVAPRFALSFLEGLALGRLALGDDESIDQGVEVLKQLGRLVLPATMTGGRS